MKISKFCKISSFPYSEWSKMSVLIQIFNTAENVRILQNFILRWSFLKMSIWAKFSTPLQISGCCQISSFAGPEWSTLSFFSQICSVTENFWIVPNFILCMSRVVKTLNFGLDFDCDWKFLNFTTFHPLHVQSGQKCQLWAKFLTPIKISWFCKISSFAGQEWSKSRLQAEFSTRLKISGFCHISSFAGLEWSKIWFLSQIFNTNQNFSGFCKILSFTGQEWSNSPFQAKFSMWLKISGFCQISSFTGLEWSKISFLSQIFNTNQNFPRFCQISSFLVFYVVKNVSFELSFQQLSKFLDFAKFHPSKIQSGQTLNLRQIFTATENFWILSNFILPMFWVVKNVSFEPSFRHD